MIAKHLEYLMDERDISAAELSRKTLVPKSNISSWLCGANPNILQLQKVAEYLGVELDYFISGRLRPVPEPHLLFRSSLNEGNYEIIIKKI